MKQYKIGVVLPTYERPDLLDNALKSIILNNYENFIVCIVDDGSSCKKKYQEVVNKYKDDKRIIYNRLQSNSGVNIARNLALDILINQYYCDYIVLLDDDDTFLPNALEDANSVMNKKYLPWIVLLCQDTNGDLITKVEKFGDLDYIYYFAYIKMQGDAAHFISSNIIEDIRFSTEIKNGQEWTFFIQVSKKTNMFVVDETAKEICYLEGGLTSTLNKLEKKSLELLDEKYLYPAGYTRKKIYRLQISDRFKKHIKAKSYWSAFKAIIHYMKNIEKSLNDS